MQFHFLTIFCKTGSILDIAGAFEICSKVAEKNENKGDGMMRRTTRVLAVFLAFLLLLPYGMTGISSKVEAANNQRYYYSQLKKDDIAKGIYDAMYEMYTKGIFKTGVEEYDLIENKHITSEQLAAYGGNQQEILKQLGIARDAFYADYPEIFYVDFSRLSIMVSETTKTDGDTEVVTYKASLGKGDRDNYFLTGFTNEQQVEAAIKAQQERVNEIVTNAKKAGSVREQVIYAHNAIIENTEYKLGEGDVRTSYGALVKGQSLCEGYARAVKTVLDNMGITSVLVQGIYRESDGSENLHMWNYVQIDGKWYGLDATANDGMKGSIEEDKYLLADKSVMGTNHKPNGDMSNTGFQFTYPQLADADGSEDKEETPDEGNTDDENTDDENIDDEGYKTVFDKEGFLVKYRDGAEFDTDTGVFKVSYKGMGYQEAVDKEGVYILTRFYQFEPGTGQYKVGDWGYSDPKPFMMPQLADALIIANGNSRYIEFAITKKAPAGPLYGDNLSAEEVNKNWTFQGTEKDFIVATGKLDNPKGTYVPSPFARKLTPSATGFLSAGKKYHIIVEFNETLIKIDDNAAVGYELTVEKGTSAIQKSKIENFTWDEKNNKVEFDFTPSDYYADNGAVYTFQITNLQGKGSLKAPDSFCYSAKKKIAVCAYRPQGILWNLGAKPELLEPSDIFCGDWKTEDGKLLQDMTNIVLTASAPKIEVEKPSQEQTNDMLDKIDETLPAGCSVGKSATYNIRLLTCNQNIVKTGQSVRLHIGFPEGFGDAQAGVTYKAYHFSKDKDGNITGVDELECIVVEKGLIVTCMSFSPFAIVEVKVPEGSLIANNTDQKLLVMNSNGGDATIQGSKDSRICTLSEEGQTKTVKIEANSGYKISGIYLNNQAQTISNEKSMNFSVKYEALAGEGNVLEVVFTQDKPSTGTQQNSSSSQSSSSSVQSSSSSSGSSSNTTSSNTTSSNTTSSNSVTNSTNNNKTNDTKTDNIPVVEFPVVTPAPTVTEQVITPPPAPVGSTTPPASVTKPAESSSSNANITNDITTIDGNVSEISSGQGDNILEVIEPDAVPEEEYIVLSTGENALVVMPAEDADSSAEEPGMNKTILAIIICSAVAIMAVVAVVGFVQIRRD